MDDKKLHSRGGGQISATRAHGGAINDFEGAVVSGFAHNSLKFVIRPPENTRRTDRGNFPGLIWPSGC